MRSELAQTSIYVLARRMRLAFLDVQAALIALPRVIDIMSEELKWNEKRRAEEWAEGVKFLKSMGLPPVSTISHENRCSQERKKY